MHKLFAALGLFLLSVVAAGGPQMLEPQEFADSYIQQLQSKLPEAEIERLGTLHLSVGFPGSEDMQVYLDNAWRSYLQDPDSLTAVLDMYTASVAESITSALEPIDIARIVPVVKEPAWLDDIRSSLAEQGLEEMPEYVQVPLNDHLIVLYAEDTPTNIRYLEKETLGKLEVPLTDLQPMALENLRILLPEIEIMGGDGLYLLTAGGNYEASLLLYDELWTHQNFPVEGEIVVGLPTRDVLMVGGTAGGDRLEQMREFVKDAYEEGVYSLSPRLFVRRADEWVVYE